MVQLLSQPHKGKVESAVVFNDLLRHFQEAKDSKREGFMNAFAVCSAPGGPSKIDSRGEYE
jgi:hypothetical protein